MSSRDRKTRRTTVRIAPELALPLILHVLYTCTGGYYHGKLIFPKDYPFKPPRIMMMTPNGRFQTNTRLCLSISDFHPDLWNPAWSVATILTGLLSFMVSLYTCVTITTSISVPLHCFSSFWVYPSLPSLPQSLLQ